ncbi:hypothetical protein J3R82DRAFT_9275 [Butyriboletus roseoflavus]|nr:hypothetical protein J3R82DRAFT_9275 [Butyriboletus roseoflavus]
MRDCRSLEAYLLWSGPSTTLRAFKGEMTNVDRKIVPALSASYEQFCEVFNAASSSKQSRIGILISLKECFVNRLKCMFSSVDFDTAEYNMIRPTMRTSTLWNLVVRIKLVPLLWPWNIWADVLTLDWSYLRGIVPPSELFEFLELPWWNSYIDANTLEKICHSTPYAQLIGEIFIHRSKTYRTWRPGHWLCMTCLQTFMRDNTEAFCRSRGYPEQVDQ